eukprot:2646129-Amphidinium_carterae.1
MTDVPEEGGDLLSLCRALRAEFERVTIPRNHNRANLLDERGQFQRSLLLGAFTVKGCGVTAATKSPKFARLLELVHLAAKKRSEDIAYSGIMLNMGVSAEVHRDISNVTFNDVLVLGEFSGGDIIVECEGGSESLELPDGKCVHARRLDRVGEDQWLTFDATHWHQVTKACGNRLSVVLFCVRGLHRLTDEDWRCMSQKGFRVRELQAVGQVEMETKTPSRPLDISALRYGLSAAGLMHRLNLAEGSEIKAEKESLPRKRLHRRRNVSCSGTKVIADLLAGRHVHVYQLMCSLPFTSLPSDFGYYFGQVRRLLHVHGLEKARSVGAAAAGSGRRRSSCPQALFPVGLPYPEVYMRAEVPVSGRRRARFCRERSLRITLNQIVLFGSWLSMGRSCGDLSIAASMCPLSPLQWQLVGQIRSDLLRVCRPEDACVLEGGGHEKLEKTLRGLEEQKPYSVHTGAGSGTEVVTLSASNMALPDRAAEIELTWPRVPRAFEQILRTPGIFDLDRESQPLALPRFHMAVSSWPEVACKLWSSGLICLRKCDGDSVGQRAGLFGVPRKGSCQVRMICDRRQRNCVERSMLDVLAEVAVKEEWDMSRFLFLRRLCLLPHPSQFAELMAPGDASVLGSSEDATDYFHLIKAPECRIGETIVGWPLYRHELSSDMLTDPVRGAGGSDALHFNCHMLSVPMGDQKSMDVAQMLHVWSLVSRKILRADENWMSYRYKAPSGPHWGGCYCDDLGLVSIMSEYLEGALNLSSGALLKEHRLFVARARDAYTEVGIIRKESKAVECAEEVSMWGSVISSKRQDVGGDLTKQRQLVGATVRVAHRQSLTVGQMEKLVGCWTFHLLYQRCSLCLLSAVYRWLEHRRCLRPKGASFRITREVRDELIGLVTFWSLCRSSYTDAIYEKLICTDATTSWGGAVDTTLDIDQAVWLWSRRRGHHYPVAGSVEEMMDGAAAILRDPNLEELVGCLSFQETLRYKFRKEQHINVLEGHAWKSALKALCSESASAWHSRVIFGIDSQVLCCAIQRGRSGSVRLNEMLRCALPYQLLCRVRSIPLWLSTKANPADDPTRGARVRSALDMPEYIKKEVSEIRAREPVAWHATRFRWDQTQFDQTKGFPGEGPLDDDDDEDEIWGTLGEDTVRPYPAAPRLRKRRVPDDQAPQNLRDSVLPVTALRYSQRVDHLASWLYDHHGVELSSLVQNVDQLVPLLQQYLQWMYEQDYPVSHGSWCLAGLQYRWPELVGRLRGAWKSQSQWQRVMPSRVRTPIPLEVMLAMCTLAFHWRWPRMGCAILLCFHALLRPGELANGMRQHLILPNDLGGSPSSGVYCIPRSKTSNRTVLLQSVVIEDSLLLGLLQHVYRFDGPTTTLVKGGMSSLLLRWDLLKHALDIHHSPWGLSSLRGGGAVEYVRRTGNVGYLRFRGRWFSDKSMLHYIQMGLSASAFCQLPTGTRNRIQLIASQAPALIFGSLDIDICSLCFGASPR